MLQTRDALLGVDVGTQGIRVVAVDTTGEILSRHNATIPLQKRGIVHEQSPEEWWDSLLPLLQAVATDLRTPAGSAHPLALSVTSTSGTVIPLAADHSPLHAAVMYDDKRSASQAERCRAESAGTDQAEVSFGSSFGLPKIVWYAESHPHDVQRIASWCHAADFVVGRLSGVWGITDPTNALKTGYDVALGTWPTFITERLGIPAEWLPGVVPSGSVVGQLRQEIADVTGLPTTMLITTGMTDGCSSQIATGAVEVGEWSTTIGTTLVIKGVTHRPILDPFGRLYNHRHPEGWWMPGGASNTGADWIARDYGGQDLTSLDTAARNVIPSPWIAYPLTCEGERFPFVAPQARGFESPDLTKLESYVARLEGIAYLERLAYEMLTDLSGEEIDRVSTAGGGSRSSTWLTIRANVLRKPVLRMRHADAAVGAAILAASTTIFDGLSTAARSMTQPEQEVHPGVFSNAYEEGYGRFISTLTERGYLSPAGRSK